MKKLIFDFDGTLLDSRQRHTVLLRDICRENGLALPDGNFDGYLAYKQDGHSTFEYLTEYVKYPALIAKMISQQWAARIEAPEYLALDRLYSDVPAFFQQAAASAQVELLLISARQSKTALLRQLSQYGIDRFFSNVYCVSPSHAKAEKSAAAAEHRDAICFIGDTEADCFAAASNEIPFYALNRGFRSKAYWDHCGILSHTGLPALNTLVL